jgi:hypothetical protein
MKDWQKSTAVVVSWFLVTALLLVIAVAQSGKAPSPKTLPDVSVELRSKFSFYADDGDKPGRRIDKLWVCVLQRDTHDVESCQQYH